ncbi:serine hydrolase [Pedobacter sp. SD-b]|uniref:Serine hydrolase n=1 Tax=Pedobacter segetis TaxID=2793069 RepID=A0ABS1BEY1_9SPHI|nr:serine hydrolase [Pedobacter segetis]MBK0381370.1 serine hydrolase [Pedobacter segetis]
MYFPPKNSNDWEKISPKSLNWDEEELNRLYPYLESKHTNAFIILKNGKMVCEKYFGNFTDKSFWYWASAGKTVTGLLVGIAQSEGLLNINHKTSDYLGEGWTAAPIEKENLITIKDQLSMTTGLDDSEAEIQCTQPSCFQYKTDAGTRWSYNTATYTVLDRVIEKASGKSFNDYFNARIKNKIGMIGFWKTTKTNNNVLFSDARSMARFGLLLLNKGKWGENYILKDENYFNAQINSSQGINPSYGYLTWLNGKNGYMLPTSQRKFSDYLIPNAPADLFAALGKNDQKIYVVPSQNLVVIRMGEKSGNSHAALSNFDNELWGKLKQIIKY